MAMSIDGHTIMSSKNWELGSQEDKRRMDKLREWSDCVICSRKSLSQDNANLFIRRKKNKKKQPIPVMVLQNINKPILETLNIFKKPHPNGIIFVHTKSIHFDQKKCNWADVQILLSNFSSIDKKKIFEKWQFIFFNSIVSLKSTLSKQRLNKILLEGGGQLNGFFLQENLIDELYTTIVPFAWGGNTSDRYFVSSKYLDIKKFKLINVEQRNNEVFLKYKKLSLS